MSTRIYDRVLEKLEATKGCWPEVAQKSGVSIRTLSKIARKEIKDPRISTVQRLADYFESAQNP